jgi:hypothetical protein
MQNSTKNGQNSFLKVANDRTTPNDDRMAKRTHLPTRDRTAGLKITNGVQLQSSGKGIRFVVGIEGHGGQLTRSS